MTSYMKAYGEQLASLGYPIVPIMPGTKKPGVFYGGTGIGWADMRGWASFGEEHATPNMIKNWTTFPDAGVGIVTGKVVAVDIDILDEQLAGMVEDIIVSRLGPTRAVRVGKWPKRLLVYRTTAPFSKIKAGCIEVLGRGQQFVSYAKHPDTGEDYKWTDADLHSIPLGMLPVVHEDQVRAAVDEAVSLLPPEMQVRRVDPSTREVGESERGLRAHDDAIASAAEALKNPDYSWDDWNRVGMALWAATAGSDVGYRAFHAFSGRSDKYSAKETDARWDSYFRTPPTAVGAGTIFHLARADGWVPPGDIDFRSGRVDVSDFDLEVPDHQEATEATPDAQPERREPDPEPEPHVPATGALFERPSGDFPYDEWLGNKFSPISHIANWIVDTSMYPHPSFALFNTLTMLGTVFGRRYTMEGLNTRTNLMCIAVAPSGSGKDHSRKKIKQLLTGAGMEKMLAGEGIASGAALVSMLHESPSKLAQLDEMGYFLQGITSAKSPQYYRDIGKKMLELYSSSGSLYLGTQYADLKTNARKDIHSPNLCVYGTTTLTTLTDGLKHASREDGTLARFLLVDRLSDPHPRKADAGRMIDDARVQWLRSYLDFAPEGDLGDVLAADYPPSLVTVHWGEGVEDVFYALKDWERSLRIKGGTIWTRFAENAIKIAMIDAIASDMVSPRISKPCLQRAINLVYWCLKFAERLIREESAENDTEAKLKRVLKAIKAAGERGVTKTELLHATQTLQQRDRDEIVKTLIDMEEIGEAQDKTPGKRGPKATRYYALR